jgi:NitT/TauT family transport system substrate-binding protein
MRYISTHDAAEIVSVLPEAYFEGDKPLYSERLALGKAMFTTDGRMPESCPEMALKAVLSFSRKMQEKQIDLSKTYTTSFVERALASMGR